MKLIQIDLNDIFESVGAKKTFYFFSKEKEMKCRAKVEANSLEERSLRVIERR